MSQFVFTDDKGRKWDVGLTLGLAKFVDTCDFSEYVGEGTKFTILKPDKETFHQLLTNTPFMFAVIYMIVRRQIVTVATQSVEYRKHQSLLPDASPPPGEDSKGIHNPPWLFDNNPDSNEDAAQMEFCDAITGPVVQAARQALWGSLGDFFQDQKTALSALMKQFEKGHQKVAARMISMMEPMEKLLDQELDQAEKVLWEEIKKDLPGTLSTASSVSSVDPSQT